MIFFQSKDGSMQISDISSEEAAYILCYLKEGFISLDNDGAESYINPKLMLTMICKLMDVADMQIVGSYMKERGIVKVKTSAELHADLMEKLDEATDKELKKLKEGKKCFFDKSPSDRREKQEKD